MDKVDALLDPVIVSFQKVFGFLYTAYGGVAPVSETPCAASWKYDDGYCGCKRRYAQTRASTDCWGV